MSSDARAVSQPPAQLRFYDAHNHLQDERFAGRQDALLAEATRAGVARMVVNGSCESDWASVRELAMHHREAIPAFGYHPWHVTECTSEWQTTLIRFLDETPGAVVGEAGLDRWKPGLSYDGQEEVFVRQLRLAAERNISISIHCLQAWGRLFDLLRQEARPQQGFLLHSYGGPVEMVKPLAALGAYFSFPGYYLHERKTRQRETFSQIPLDRLLVETDAPDQCLPEALNTHPLHDPVTAKALNHPANLPVVYDHLAGLRGVTTAELALQVETNFKAIFGV